MANLMFYEQVFKALNEAKVSYLVAGGMAVFLHGVERTTRDLDLWPELTPENLKKMVGVLTKLGFRPRVPVNPYDLADAKIRESWQREKNLTAFSFYHPSAPLEAVDILLEANVNYGRARKARVKKSTGKVVIPILSIPDLIAMKAAVARPKDLWDVKTLRKVKKDAEEIRARKR
jgi:hypothetical protein